MKGGIRTRLLLAAALPAILVTLLLLAGFLERHTSALQEALCDRGRAEARQLAIAADFPLFSNNREGLQQLVEAVKASDPQLLGVAIFDHDGKRRALAGKLTAPLPQGGREGSTLLVGDTLLVSAPIASTLGEEDLFSGTRLHSATERPAPVLGQVVIELSLEVLRQQRHDLLMWALATTAGALLLAALLSSLIASSVTRPIRDISRVVSRIGEGALEARTNVAQAGVLATLAAGINAMAAQVAVSQEELQQKVKLATAEMRRQKEAAELAARIDPLTGVFNRRAFAEIAEMEVQRALRYGNPLSLIMMDLDHFKGINDAYGHGAGDAVLASFSRTVAAVLRDVDIVGRIGGEEFVVLLPDTGVSEAMQAAERIRQAVAGSQLQILGRRLSYSASFGVAEFDPTELSFSGFLAKADTALYKAKSAGRNRVEQAARSAG